jgi:hypothetical protein
MAVSSAVYNRGAGVFYPSGAISFSSLRENFRETTTGSVSLSEYIRDTNIDNTNPVVPEATENSTIPTTTSNIRLSSYRNSIKYYGLTQSGTDLNLSIGSQSWNSNLLKNVQKVFTINGTLASNTTGTAAANMSTDAYNFSILVNGGVYGAGGAINSPGGNALLVSTTRTISIILASTANVFGGGGGGANGATGRDGPVGTCFYHAYYFTGYACGSCPSCDGNVLISCLGDGGGCNCSKKRCGNTNYRSQCRARIFYQVRGGFGGGGGSGAGGIGYNNGNNVATAGLPGEAPFCSDPELQFAAGGVGSFGENGENGGNGGNWGAPGGATSIGSGGPAGRAIAGSSYALSGSTGSANIKG